MSGRSFDQLAEAVAHARSAGDAPTLQQLARELEAIGTVHAMSTRAHALGCAAEINGNLTEAFEHFKDALALQDERGDPRIAAEIAYSIGTVQYDMGHYRQALEYWQRSRALYEQIGDRPEVARLVGKIGVAHEASGSYNEALEHYRHGLAMYEELGDRRGVAAMTGSIGIVHYYTGQYAQALQEWQQALGLYEELGERTHAARITGNMGNVYQSIGEYEKALEQYHRALAVHEELRELRSIALVTRNLGNVYRSTGNYPQALEYFHRSLGNSQDLGNRSGMAAATASIGNVYHDIGDYPRSLEFLHRALALHEETGSQGNVAHVNGFIGVVHSSTGSYTLALDYLNRALAVYEQLGERSGIARVTGNIGFVHSKIGDHSQALEYYDRALTLHKEIGNRVSEIIVTGSIIGVYIDAKMFTEAEALLAVMVTMQISDPSIVILRETALAMVQQHHGNTDEAVQILRSTLAIARQYALPAEEADLYKRLRDLCYTQNDLAGYVENNNEYVRITEEISGKEAGTKLAMQEKQRELDTASKEHQRHLAVLYSTLPRHVADRVVRGDVVNDHYDNAAVLFIDIVGFTNHSAALDPGVVVDLLQRIFTAFDAICAERSVMKIKTIGDSYMAAAFPSDHHIVDLAATAIAMNSSYFTWPHTSERVLFRIGLHVGPVVAGVLGTEQRQFDVWGDTVSIASTMESSGEPGRIHASEAFAIALNTQNDPSPHPPISLSLLQRGTIDIKGKDTMTTYWIEGTAA